MAQPGTDPRDAEEFTIKGELGTSSVPDLLRSIAASGETGVLMARRGEVTKSVYIQQGRPVYAASDDLDERLGESLLVRGRITARQYVEASRQMGPGRRLGAVLVEMEAIEPNELMLAVEAQVREILVDLMTWTHGDYEFAIKEMDPSELLALDIPIENVIMEGIRRSRAWSQVQNGIGDIESVPVPSGNAEVLQRLELTEEEQEVLSHVNGRSSVEQICQVSYLSNFETCRILWALQLVGAVRRTQTGDEAAAQVQERELELEEIVEKFNQMFGRIYGFLKGRIGDSVDGFMEEALEEVSRQYGSLFAGVDLRSYGRADFEQMLANVADQPPEQRRSVMLAGLNELVVIIQLAVRIKRGAQEEAVVSGIIKDALRKLGAA